MAEIREWLDTGALVALAGVGLYLIRALANDYSHKLDKIIELLEGLVKR